MKRVGGRGRGWTREEEEEGRVSCSGETSTSLPTRAPLRSPRSREAHDRGTRRSRRAILSIVVACVLLAVGRPVYGPYIDRFGERGDASVISLVQHGLAKRARKHELTLPRSWGHHRYGPDGEGEIVGSLVGGKLDADKNEHASERFSWRKAYEHLRKSGLAERERVLRLMWERLVVAESAPEKLALADERVPGVNL